MTDYASQGKSRDTNVVDLEYCKDHHGIYVALSRGRTSDGTLIVRKGDLRKLKKKCSGALRQEYRELELLDDITMRAYEGTLSPDINGHRRLDLIAQFRQAMGKTYMPSRLPDALRWTTAPAIFNNKGECVDVTSWLDSHCPPIDWTVVNEKEAKSSPAKDVQSEFQPFERVRNANAKTAPRKEADRTLGSVKRPRIDVHEPDDEGRFGAQWHANSCAYDCIATFCAWLSQEDTSFASRAFAWDNNILHGLVSMVENQLTSRSTDAVSRARDNLRDELTLSNPREFVHGAYASVLSILETITVSNDIALTTYVRCTCKKEASKVNHKELLVCTASQESLTGWFKSTPATTHDPCKSCGNTKTQHTTVRNAPPFIAFQVHDSASLSMQFEAKTHRSASQYVLKGVIYFGSSHFTMRVIEQTMRVYKYDGMKDDGKIRYESYASDISDWTHLDGRGASVAIYTIVA